MLSFLLDGRPDADVVAVADDGTGARVPIPAARLRDDVADLRVRLGDVHGAPVLVACRRPLAFLTAALAVIDAGGVLVPVNLRQSEDVRAQQRATLRPAAVIGDDGIERLDAPRHLDPSVALILQTSGSTGATHHVLLGLDGLRANVDAILSYLPLRTHRRPAITLPLWYSYALVGQAFTGLRAGATIVLLGDEPWAVRQLAAMRDHHVDGLSSVPTAARALAETALDLAPPERPRLAYVAFAGEVLDARVVARVRHAFPGARLFNQYGLTEASPRVCAIGDHDPGFDRGAAGYPLPGVRVAVAHADGRAVTADDPAEVRVRGPSIMRGYLDDAAGAMRAVRDGELHTGDLGWIDPEGRLYIVGRRDDVVKISGERVSLVGVERVLLAHPGTDEAVVLGFPDPAHGIRITAFVRTDDEAGLRAWARDRLAPVARPHRWLRVEAMPRNTHGKVDRAALRALAAHQATT